MSTVFPNTPDFSAINGYNVKLYGLKGDGSTNDRDALNTLLNTTAPEGATIYFPPGTYIINTTGITCAKTFNYVGFGATIKTTSNIILFLIGTASGQRTTFSGLKFLGNDSGSNQYGIYFNGTGAFSVNQCWFTDMGGGGIAAINLETSTKLGGIISSSHFYSGNLGVELQSRAEYVQVVDCDFNANTKSIYFKSGNVIINGNNINYSDTGIEHDTGTNNGHSIISNNNINHCGTYGLNLHDTTLGMTVSGNHIYQSPIRIKDTTGVNISGGEIDVLTYTLDTNVGLIFNGVRFSAIYNNTITLTGTAPLYVQCYNMSGLPAVNADLFTPANNVVAEQPILYGATTDAATAVELTTDGAAGSGATNRIAVPANASLSIVMNIGVKQSGSANAKQMLRQVVITNNGGTTALSGTPIALGTDTGDAGLATVTCTITANNTDDCLKVEVNGVVATNLRYTCYIVSVQTIYP